MNGIDFTTVFNQHKKDLRAFFINRGCGDESDDLVQQTFLKAYRNADQLREEERVREWLFVIARNLWKNHIRSRHTLKSDVHKEVRLDSLEWSFTSQIGNPLLHLLKDERLTKMQQDLLHAMNDLPPQMRQCMLLRVFQDLKYEKIAQVMQLNVNTVKSHINKARKKLQSSLDPSMIEPEIYEA